ncbi:dihydrolipoyllysine-residue (2-methylpropanoyl)transferase [Permianibacter sp. IMCC34836]|uniref:2-oxo acid dehydrogenase subunit E2 n=1 Tax=Permianibacter fluminis TaxID=2738515 RepID=UPI0015517ED6|nr:2-oxo acid dehydrogenase subunit E2 [Permianibacter fluminis]NQD38082.1 dihydrolipoyllysine-residue (2-methylpropanoyl)transferase [Permianibacter fluminis]
MSFVFELPDLGEGLPDATIVKWLIKEGDTVKVDQPIAEMETAKAVVEVPSPVNGVILKLHGKAGDVIITHAPLVTFGNAGEKLAAAPAAAPAPSQSVPSASASMHSQVAAGIPAAPASGGGEVFLLPDLGEGLPDATIVKWLVKEGDTVKVDQPIAEMETAKAVVEVPSPFNGVIAKLHGKAGDVIITHAPLVTFGGSAVGGSAAAVPAPSKKDEAPADAGTVVGAVQVGNTIVAETSDAVVKALAKKLGVDLNQVKGTGAGGKISQADVKSAAAGGLAKSMALAAAPVATSTNNPLAFRASPAVRKLANELGVDLSRCNSSGPKGTITRDDVKSASTGASAPVAARTTAATAVAAPAVGARLPTVTVQVKPEAVRGVRRAMAQAMTLSHQTVVPVTLMEDANISKWKKGEDSLARYIRALCAAAKVEPALNAWFDGANMERLLHPNVNVGIAVDTPDGLYVPVVSEAQAKSNAELRADVETLRKKIADKAIKPTDLSGATITLSNYGSIAGRYGTPIVSPPQVAILGCGRFRNELKLTDKGIENAKMLPLSLSFDHRACTGGEGARFLAAVIADLEKPE